MTLFDASVPDVDPESVEIRRVPVLPIVGVGADGHRHVVTAAAWKAGTGSCVTCGEPWERPYCPDGSRCVHNCPEGCERRDQT